MMEQETKSRTAEERPSWSETEQQRMQGRKMLLGAVAAEFAQPLNLIAMNQEFLRLHLEHSKGDFSRQQVQQALEGIGCAANRLDRLIQNGLDLLACLEGEMKPQCIPLNLGAVLQDLCAGSDEIERLCGIHLQTDIPADAMLVMADRAMVERIFLNLLSNALRACSSGGTIRVMLRGGPDGGEILVQDDGCGIPAELAARAFEPHETGLAPVQMSFLGGAGLGLQLCGAFCRLLGWKPEILPCDQGTTVRLTIPAGIQKGECSLVFHSAAMEEQGRERTRDAVLRELHTVPGLETLQII